MDFESQAAFQAETKKEALVIFIVTSLTRFFGFSHIINALHYAIIGSEIEQYHHDGFSPLLLEAAKHEGVEHEMKHTAWILRDEAKVEAEALRLSQTSVRTKST